MEVVLDVEGMTCHSCVRHVNEALGEVDGVQSVEVSIREGKVKVRHEAAEPEAILRALDEAGYPATIAG